MKREMEPYQLIERSIIKKYRKERGRGARAHDECVEDEEGQKFRSRIELARGLTWGGLGERDLRQRRPSRSACATGSVQ